MVFPISFSSFGDIVTAADLALRIAKALSSSSGSSYEYQYLIQELNSLAYVLRLCDTATRTGMLHKEVANGLDAEVVRCREVMDALWDRIRGYQKALGKRGSSSSGSSWRKIGWALFKTQDVQETRLKLATHRVNIITLMTASNISSLDDLKVQSARFESNVHTRLNEIYGIVCQLPAKLGYGRGNAITLLDWRGRGTLIPLEFCQSQTQFYATLAAVAYKWPGLARRYVHEANILSICEDTRWLLNKTEESTFMSHVIPGYSIRITNLMVNNITLTPNTDIRELSFFITYEYCDQCREGGRSSPWETFEALKRRPNVFHIGCDPYLAEWKATIEEVNYGNDPNEQQHIYTLHDPSYAGCLYSHIGVPINPLPFAQEEDPYWALGGPDMEIRVHRGRAFPYLTA